MDFSLLREQPTGKLRDVKGCADALLFFEAILPTELRIKLDTFAVNIAAILEDREDERQAGSNSL